MSVAPVTRLALTARRTAVLWRAGPAAAVLAGVALLAGACGGSGPAGAAVASIGPTGSPSASPSANRSNDAVKYSQCMRAHGVPKFPDPNPNGGIGIDAGKLGVDPGSSVFKAAEAACKSLRPQGPPPDPKQAAAAQQAMLAYSRCMRSHGIKNFPDPKFEDGRGSLSLPRSVNPNSPQFKAADATCRKLMPAPPGGAGGSTTTGDGGASQSTGSDS